MSDPVGAFTKAFTPVDGGYLYYTSAKAGGKLVTTEVFRNFGGELAAGGGQQWPVEDRWIGRSCHHRLDSHLEGVCPTGLG